MNSIMTISRFDIEAERAVLGAMLLNRDVVAGVLETLGETAAAFTDPKNAAIYEAMFGLYRDGDPLDTVYIPARLRDSGAAWPDCAIYVANLIDATPTSHNARHYAAMVARLHADRVLETETQSLLTNLRNGVMDSAEARQRMAELAADERGCIPAPTDLVNWPGLATDEIDTVFDEGLAVGRLGVLTAEGGTGKSFLALQLALSVAMGREIVRGFSPRQMGRVLCLFGEDDDQVVSRRLRAVVDGLEIPEGDVVRACENQFIQFINGFAAPLLEGDAKTRTYRRTPAFMALRDRLRREKYRLIIVDPLISWAGIENENDNAAMQAAASALIDLAVASGGAVLTLHHSNKSGVRNGDVTQASARGATSLLCAARWVAAMRTLDEKDAKKAGVSPEEAHLYCEVYVNKNSYAARNGQRTTLRRIQGGALIAVEIARDRTADLAQAIACALAEMPRGGGLTEREICRGAGTLAVELRADIDRRYGGKTTGPMLRAALKTAIETNLIEVKPDENQGLGRRREACFAVDF